MRQRSNSGRTSTPQHGANAEDAGRRPQAFFPSARGVHGATTSAGAKAKPEWPPVPELFDMVTYFRARGDSYALIANIGFKRPDDPSKSLTARGLKLWYEAELQRRSAAAR